MKLVTETHGSVERENLEMLAVADEKFINIIKSCLKSLLVKHMLRTCLLSLLFEIQLNVSTALRILNCHLPRVICLFLDRQTALMARFTVCRRYAPFFWSYNDALYWEDNIAQKVFLGDDVTKIYI